MTEDKKELPKEVVECLSNDTTSMEAAVICAHHYEPIIDGLKRENEASKNILKKQVDKHLILRRKLSDKYNRIAELEEKLAEKDKEIERLKAENQKIKDIIRLHHLDIMFSTRGIDMK